MSTSVTRGNNVLFTIRSPLGTEIRTHKSYWDKIVNVKHIELQYNLVDLQNAL